MSRTPVECGAATLALAGERESGDFHVVREFEGGALVAVVDGLGHGTEAAAVARLAAGTVEDHIEEPPIALIRRCHERLRGTRGAVMSLARFDERDETMTWVGVGNVAGVLVREDPLAARRREALLQGSGVVGVRMPRLHASVIPVLRGDTLIFATDGIDGGLHDTVAHADSAQQVADRILRLHGRRSDDALVVVVRFHGVPP